MERRDVIYCSCCGMPPEYCENGPDFETHCNPWLKKTHPDLYKKLAELRGATVIKKKTNNEDEPKKAAKPAAPRTIEERLIAFYQEHEPEKVDSVGGLLEKYAGKEDKLFIALAKKYGPEPDDPFYDSDDEDDDDSEDEDDDELEDEMDKLNVGDKKKRRGAGAKNKKTQGKDEVCRVVVQKRAQNKRRFLTVITGMETVPDVKLKDVSKQLSKKFAGSSSVKDGIHGKEIILQGDHVIEIAEMIVDKFGVDESAVFLDMDGKGHIVPFR